MMELIRKLSIRNVFTCTRDGGHIHEVVRLPNDSIQQKFAEDLTNLEKPSSYTKHIFYTNFTKFSLPTPIYINMVRDPVERIISWFYYTRAPWVTKARHNMFPEKLLPKPEWINKDFDSCVRAGNDRDCVFPQGVSDHGHDHRRQMTFFCGHDKECLPFNSEGTLQRAKHAVESQYAVVGVLEDMNTTLTVLEKYIPRFFQGATEIYLNKKHSMDTINKNSYKSPVSDEIKYLLRRNLTREIEFYQFCKQRLRKQFLAVV